MKLFQNLFKAKWKHNDPEIRKNALLDLDPDSNQGVFLEIARNDESTELRQMAVKRINSLSTLQQIAHDNAQPAVRELAQKLICMTYAGTSDIKLDPEVLSESLNSQDDQKIVEFVAQNSPDKTLRAIAIKKISREALLGDLTIKENDPVLRKLAADKIQQKSTLERVYKKIKLKDKHVSGLIKQKLDDLIQAEQEPIQRLELQKQLCLQVEALGKKGLWERDKLQFDHLLKQWNELPEPRADYVKRFERAQDSFEQSYETYLKRHEERLKQEEALLPVKEQKQSIISQLHEQLKALKSLGEDESNIEIKNISNQLKKQWDAIQQLPKEIEEEFHKQFLDVTESISRNLKAHTQNFELKLTFDQLISDLERLIQSPRRLSEKTLLQVKKTFNHAQTLGASKEINNLKSRASDLIKKAESALEKKQEQINTNLKNLETQISIMETRLEAGLLKEAMAARKTATQTANTLEKYGHRRATDFMQQINKLSSQINELANWRSWANTPQKEELCERIEALINSNEDPGEIAFIIKKAREEWKNLGPSEKDTSQQLWERFQTACDKAYEPCKTYFADEAKVRQANYEKRLAFVEDLEKFVASADWNNVDWKKVESLFRQSRNEWRNLGNTEAKQRKALNKRFYAAFEIIKTKINEEWAANEIEKQKILGEAKTLETEDNLEQAITRAKELQIQWKNAGRLSRKKEQDLWTEFRHSCDVIFGRREAIKEQEQQDLVAKAKQKADLIDELNSIVQLSVTEFIEQKGHFEKTLQTYKDFGETIKKEDNVLNKNLDEILDIYERKSESARRIRAVRQLKALRSIIEGLENLEELIETNQSAVHINEAVVSTQDKISKIKDLPDAWLDQVESRLQTDIRIASSQNFSDALKASFEENMEQKQLDTILLEILANVETPEEYSNNRLQVQAQRLEERMKNQDDEDSWERFFASESAWWLCGPVDKNSLNQFKQRHSKVINHFKQEYSEEFSDY